MLVSLLGTCTALALPPLAVHKVTMSASNSMAKKCRQDAVQATKACLNLQLAGFHTAWPDPGSSADAICAGQQRC